MAAPDFQRVRELFHDAVALPASDRVAFLNRVCGDDVALRASVDRLLKHHHPDTLLLEADREPTIAAADSLADETGPMPSGDTASAVPTPSKETGRIDFTDGSDTQPVPFGTADPDDTPAANLSRSAVGVLQRRSQMRSAFGRERRWLLAGSSLCLLLLLLLGWWVHVAIQRSIEDSLSRTLQALLRQQVFALETWLTTEEDLVQSWTRTSAITQAIATLDQVGRTEEDLQQALVTAPAADQLNAAVDEISAGVGTFQYSVWNREGTLLADSNPDRVRLLGENVTEFGASLLARVFQGETVIWLPSRSGFITQGFSMPDGIQNAPMALIAPVFATNRQKPIAAMLMADWNRQKRFEQLIQKARFRDTSDVYAFGEDGYLITESRFLKQLKRVELVAADSDSLSAQVVRVADPGGNLLEGYHSQLAPAEWPLTRAATAATAGLSGSDFDGYRDYRGVLVVGSWTWMPKYRFGIAAEIDYESAYSSLSPLHRAFGIIFAALIFAALFAVAAAIALLKIRQSTDQSMTVGPYTLKTLLGEGGFAQVYLASHALLKRPTAVKILKPEQINRRNLERFEREVQLASSLTHPNTIGIYDYGETTDGSFYYAMEYIKGPSLQELVDQDGPQVPERVVWILTQICRSLREAHARGLIHRDIKPHNVMLCRRGGECDFVKVLDFGLARSLETEQQRVTETKLLIGTPLYIAPERILDPSCMDPRSDIYSLGILGYVLLTGREPYEAAGSLEALAQSMNRAARRPSEQAPRPVPSALDRLIHDCHSRVITERPQTVNDVLQRLESVPLEEKWTCERAAVWWEAHFITASGCAARQPVAKQSDQTMLLPQNDESDEVPL